MDGYLNRESKYEKELKYELQPELSTTNVRNTGNTNHYKKTEKVFSSTNPYFIKSQTLALLQKDKF